MSNKTTISGLVVHGNGFGRKLGFPTANLDNIEGTLPEAGIYACWAQLNTERTWHQAVIHTGPRPTIHDPKIVFEVHMLDFPDRDLYGSYITCQNFIFLRKVKNFSSLEKLKKAITADCQKTRIILENSSRRFTY